MLKLVRLLFIFSALLLTVKIHAAQLLKQCTGELEDARFQESLCSKVSSQRKDRQGKNLFGYATGSFLYLLDDNSQPELLTLGLRELDGLNLRLMEQPGEMFHSHFIPQYLARLIPGGAPSSVEGLLSYRSISLPELPPLNLIFVFTLNEFNNLEQRVLMKTALDTNKPNCDTTAFGLPDTDLSASDLGDLPLSFAGLFNSEATTTARIDMDSPAVYEILENRFLSTKVTELLSFFYDGRVMIRSISCQWSDGNYGEIVVLCPFLDKGGRDKNGRKRENRHKKRTGMEVKATMKSRSAF
ncbi:MAG: hypothetical protein ACR2PT_15695 [Endozoicomonas sp.]